ncbi:hypothetical protein Tco_0031023 [Tanacetum coccineum]
MRVRLTHMAFMDLVGSKRDRLITVSFMRILRLREVARMTARIALEFAPEFVYVCNMNGWLIEDEEEVERNEVDSDLESTTSSKPVWKKTNKADHDRASRNCPWCPK